MSAAPVHRIGRVWPGAACGEPFPEDRLTTSEDQVSCRNCRVTTSPFGWLELERRGSLQMTEWILLDLAQPWFGWLATWDRNAVSELRWIAYTRFLRSRLARRHPLAAAGISAYVRDVFLPGPDALRASAEALRIRMRHDGGQIRQGASEPVTETSTRPPYRNEAHP